MEPHEERLVEEAAELESRLERLEAFLPGPVFADLNAAERRRLKAQAHYMAAYLAILQARIAAF